MINSLTGHWLPQYGTYCVFRSPPRGALPPHRSLYSHRFSIHHNHCSGPATYTYILINYKCTRDSFLIKINDFNIWLHLQSIFSFVITPCSMYTSMIMHNMTIQSNLGYIWQMTQCANMTNRCRMMLFSMTHQWNYPTRKITTFSAMLSWHTY